MKAWLIILYSYTQRCEIKALKKKKKKIQAWTGFETMLNA